MPQGPADPLRFRDQKKYADRLREAQAKTKATDALEAAIGPIGGLPAVIAVMNFEFMGGSMGTSLGEGFVTAARHAVSNDAAFVVVTSSGGARMQEGDAVADADGTHHGRRRGGQGSGPALHRDPDRPDHGRRHRLVRHDRRHSSGRARRHDRLRRCRVIEQTIREKLPEGFQRAEYLLAHGMVDQVVHRFQMRATLARLLDLLQRPDRATDARIITEVPPGQVTAPPQRAEAWRMPGMASRASDLILARLHALHPKSIDLSLGRVERLLAALGHPERRLAPVVHIAGTNGKGSTLAMLAAMLQAAGRRVDRYISPHLVPFNERILIDGAPIDEERLAAAWRAARWRMPARPITFFEITTAAAFLAFAEGPAEWVLLETGLGGRLDATNVVARPRLCLISPVSMDHESYLGDTLAKIACEKAGILKPGVPAVIAAQPPEALAAIEARAASSPPRCCCTARDWGAGQRRRDAWRGERAAAELPRPALAGTHQIDNAGLAVAAALQLVSDLDTEAIGRGLRRGELAGPAAAADRGARCSSRAAGYDALARRRPQSGGRPGAGRQPAGPVQGRSLHLVVGMLSTKDVAQFLALCCRGRRASLRPDSRARPWAGSAGQAATAGLWVRRPRGGLRRRRGARPSSRSKRHPSTS